MNKKISGILVIIIMITTIAITVIGNMNIAKENNNRNDSNKMFSTQSMQYVQPDIQGEDSSNNWVDLDNYNSAALLDAYFSIFIIKIYRLRVENDGSPHHLNGTVSIQLANHTYPFFIAFLRYQRWDGQLDYRILTNQNGYIITDYIKVLPPGDFTDMQLIVLSFNNIFNNQDVALVKAHEGNWPGALHDSLKLV